ncbi:unnamed protein product [Symbiodinium natans]|uniref:BART domain-containing protein n=1 Tax=Symbiodinium natans TaxID=878477 RepID=A0A812SS25_9DINO|nr:unnamed protein product [Symbiodinium natans]
MGDGADQLLERLSSLAPGGSSLEPVLKAFHEDCFQWEVQQFVADRAAFFTVTCADGSHPLVWTQYHDEYKGLFETHLNKVLHSLDIDVVEFTSFCEWLRVNADIFEDDTEGLYPFLQTVTASLDYNAFLAVVFAEVRRQRGETEATHADLDVQVPEGMAPGQPVVVEYLGAHYELTIPVGYEPGMVFRTCVAL